MTIIRVVQNLPKSYIILNLKNCKKQKNSKDLILILLSPNDLNRKKAKKIEWNITINL